MSMELTKRLWEQPTDKGVLAYHIIQSFSPGEATPDQVHEIGCEFAQRFLADRFECTVSTHLDKGHLHNHIVVNSVSYADGKMFRNNFDTYYHGIRQVSDELCRENRLSVIETDGKGKSYDEWLSGQTGKPTIRGMVRKDVEQAICTAFVLAVNIVARNLRMTVFAVRLCPRKLQVKVAFAAGYCLVQIVDGSRRRGKIGNTVADKGGLVVRRTTQVALAPRPLPLMATDSTANCCHTSSASW